MFTLTDRASTIRRNIRGWQSDTWSAGQKKNQRNIDKASTNKNKTKMTKIASSNSRPRSRLSFWSRKEGSALPPRVGLPILHARAEFGAYSQALLLPPAFRDRRSLLFDDRRDRDGAAAACSSLLPLRTVWRVGLAEVAPSTPSGALLVHQATRAASH